MIKAAIEAVVKLKRGQRRWTDEQRAERARLLRARAPWLKSTGPKTVAGKKRSSMNAFKHGHKSRQTLRLRGLLRRHRAFLAKLAVYRRAWWKEQKKLDPAFCCRDRDYLLEPDSKAFKAHS